MSTVTTVAVVKAGAETNSSRIRNTEYKGTPLILIQTHQLIILL
jgi:hypothetical protein